ncbi:MAG: VanZ family protein [Peptostreptococcaceae bacterium]
MENRKKGEKFNLKDEILTNLFILYLFLLVGIMMFSISIGTNTYLQELSFIRKCNMNLVPFIDYFSDYMIFSVAVRNIIGNTLLLMPFILYLCIKYEKFRSFKVSTMTAFLYHYQ